MELKEFKEKIQELSPNLTEKQQEQFYNYMNLLIEWNNKINLTAITEPNEIIVKHFIDSMTILKEIENIPSEKVKEILGNFDVKYFVSESKSL